MKKSLLALAVLGAFASAASAQSSVTLYGRVDLSVNKAVGTENKELSNGSGSRLGVRGVEDLGGGLKALFQIETRFDADTGVQTSPTRFWHARSIVGLSGGFGQIVLGREYTTAFLMNQLIADPWGWDTVVSSTGTGLNQKITGGGGFTSSDSIAKVRNDSSATYTVTMGGFSFGAQIAEATDALVSRQNKPWNVAAAYAAGPVWVSFGYEVTGEEAAAKARWASVAGSYNLGAVKLGAFYGDGRTAADAKRKSYLVSATAPLGQGEFRASYGRLKNESAGVSVNAHKGFGLGYHYSLSKRTTVYADFVRNTGTAVTNDERNGYDVGIKHNF